MQRTDARTFANIINKKLGADTVFIASDMVVSDRFTSGSLSLDVALGGGFPANQWVEVLGKESAGKTAMVLKAVAANQKRDPSFMTFWVAGEHYDVGQAKALGVDNDRVQVASTQVMEVGLQLLVEAAESHAFDCLVLDSFPALIPNEEDEKAMDEFVVAVGAKLFGKFWRKVGKSSKRAHDGSEKPMLPIIINQYRDKIGGFARFGVPQTSPGGHAKDYSYFVRLEISRTGYINEKMPGVKEPTVVGQEIKMLTIKNKSAPPRQVAFVDFYFRDAPLLGFRRGDYDLGKEYVALAILYGVIKKNSGWYYYGDRKWNGKESVEIDVRSEPELQADIAEEVLVCARNPRAMELDGTLAEAGA